MCFSHQQKGGNKKPGKPAANLKIFSKFHGKARRNGPKTGHAVCWTGPAVGGVVAANSI